jgi:hypothetical protein
MIALHGREGNEKLLFQTKNNLTSEGQRNTFLIHIIYLGQHAAFSIRRGVLSEGSTMSLERREA